jgi:hypothetical protein
MDGDPTPKKDHKDKHKTISAEAWSKVIDYKPIVIPKSEDQKQRLI